MARVFPWGVHEPMPDPPIRITIEEAVPCTVCDDEGLVEDECWSPEYLEQTRDRTWPGNGYLICGLCGGDGWYWRDA